MAQAATGTETTRDEDSAMNELQMLEIIWLLLKLMCFMLGLLAGMLLGYAVVWRPLDRALQAEIIWQAHYAVQAGPLVSAPQPSVTYSVAIWLAALWQVLRSTTRSGVRHDR